MFEILNILLIGIALSMDAFSIALSIGTLSIQKQKRFEIAIIVGIFHLFMPLFGLFLGNKIITVFHINAHILMSGILLLIAFEMFKNAFDTVKSEYKVSLIGVLGISFTVSIDSFSTGIALGALTNHIFISALIFACISFISTYLGLYLGNKTKSLFGKYAEIIGATLLIIIALIHFAL